MAQQLSELKNKKPKESSGLAARLQAKKIRVCFEHTTIVVMSLRFYLVYKDLNVKLTVSLSGIENRDWEDITVGPGPE